MPLVINIECPCGTKVPYTPSGGACQSCGRPVVVDDELRAGVEKLLEQTGDRLATPEEALAASQKTKAVNKMPASPEKPLLERLSDVIGSLFARLGGSKDDESLAEQLADVKPIREAGQLRSRGLDELPGAHGPFGRSANNPIPANGPIGEIKYLNHLVCACGAQLMGHRLGSVPSQVAQDPVDLYEVVCGEQRCHPRHCGIAATPRVAPKRSRGFRATHLTSSLPPLPSFTRRTPRITFAHSRPQRSVTPDAAADRG